MADLYFGRDKEEADVYVQSYLRQLWVDAYGKGGFRDMAEFMTKFDATMFEREKQDMARHRSNTTKLNGLIVIGTFLLVVVTLLAAWITTIAVKHSELSWPLIFQIDTKPPSVYAESEHPSDAAVPPPLR